MGVKNSRERYVYVGLRVPKRRPTNPHRDERGIGVYGFPSLRLCRYSTAAAGRLAGQDWAGGLMDREGNVTVPHHGNYTTQDLLLLEGSLACQPR
jgi:hypothetical protein